MYIDKLNEFADAQALSASGASTNYIDLGSDRNIGPGRPLFVVISVTTSPDGTTGDETYSIAVQTDDNSSFSSATSSVSVAIPRSAPVGTRYVLGFPYDNERYVRLYGTLGGTTPSIGFSAHLTDQLPPAWAALPGVL